MNIFSRFWNWLFGNTGNQQDNSGGTVTDNTPTTDTGDTTMSGKRYAVLAGSNFVGTPNQLSGCINDMIDVRKLIEGSGITILADLRDHQMTAANWKAALQNAAAVAVAGDVIYHAHSHHGAQIEDPTEADGLDEVWCSDDFDWSPEHMITDKWMGNLMKSLKPGVIWVDHADCCHAGDSLRKFWDKNEKPKYIPNPALEGSFKVRALTGPMVVAGADRLGILLAACRSSETSADAFINGEHCGAFTHFMLQAIKENPSGTYESLMLRATQLLGLGSYGQHPELDCKPNDNSRVFSKDILGK